MTFALLSGNEFNNNNKFISDKSPYFYMKYNSKIIILYWINKQMYAVHEFSITGNK